MTEADQDRYVLEGDVKDRGPRCVHAVFYDPVDRLLVDPLGNELIINNNHWYGPAADEGTNA